MVTLPIELGVFYIRHPSEERGNITSIVRKDFLHVIGDGRTSVSELLDKSMRASLQFNKAQISSDGLLEYVPNKK